LEALCVGCPTGEILLYSLSIEDFMTKPRLILIPDPKQKAGRVLDIIICNSPYKELAVIQILIL